MTEPKIDDHGRIEPEFGADEIGTLTGFLCYQRATLEWKCRGLTDEQLRVSIAASSMTLGGMLKHLAEVEDFWFTEVVDESEPSEPWVNVDWKADRDWDWHSAADDSGDYLRELWSTSVDRSNGIVQRALTEGTGLDGQHPAWGGREMVSLRWVLVHMIEEYARHNGHADLIREAIDGETGE